MTSVECPQCGEQFAVDLDVLFQLNRFFCSVCDALLEVIEENPIILEIIDEGLYDDDEDDDDDDDIVDWADG